jgi:hypothetical protein
MLCLCGLMARFSHWWMRPGPCGLCAFSGIPSTLECAFLDHQCSITTSCRVLATCKYRSSIKICRRILETLFLTFVVLFFSFLFQFPRQHSTLAPLTFEIVGRNTLLSYTFQFHASEYELSKTRAPLCPFASFIASFVKIATVPRVRLCQCSR